MSKTTEKRQAVLKISVEMLPETVMEAVFTVSFF